METGKKYFITAEVPCPHCKGKGAVLDHSATFAAKRPIKQTCQMCQGSGKAYTQEPLEEALKDFGILPKKCLEDQIHEQYMEYLGVKKESNTVEYRGYTLRKATLLSGWEVEFDDGYNSLHMDWQEALAFVDARLRKDIPEPQL